MSIHINRFVDRVRSAEHRGQKDITMTMADARDLQADLTKLLLALHAKNESKSAASINKIEINGGEF